MFYTVYKVTCLTNGKYYIGKHQTKNLDDGYLGSGLRLTRALRKYGKENFIKEILYVVDSQKKMDIIERILVVPDEETNYNMCRGGGGGMLYLDTPEGRRKRQENLRAWYTSGTKRFSERYALDPQFKKTMNDHLGKISKIGTKRSREKYPEGTFRNRNHTDDTKARMRQSHQGKHEGMKNSQFGTRWITDGQINRKVLKTEMIPLGWRPGRKMPV